MEDKKTVYVVEMSAEEYIRHKLAENGDLITREQAYQEIINEINKI